MHDTDTQTTGNTKAKIVKLSDDPPHGGWETFCFTRHFISIESQLESDTQSLLMFS